MTILLTFVHYVVCIFLIIVVLLQSGKAADLAGAFGGMGSQTVFGPRGSATVLSKATTIAAVLFMVTSLSLSIIATRGGGKSGSSVLDKAKAAPAQQKPGTPQPGATVPLTVTPIGPNGEKGTPGAIQAPLVPAPAPTPAK
jgi:preprotein translocase subunit SecG